MLNLIGFVHTFQLYFPLLAVFYCCENEILITRYPVIFNFGDRTGQLFEKKSLGGVGYRDPVRACQAMTGTHFTHFSDHFTPMYDN